MSDPLDRLQEGLAERYRIQRVLGRGGMATVYLAQDLRHDRPVALKLLHPELAASLGPERFLREIKLAAQLQHPHILSVHDSGETSGRLWFSMPYVRGESLQQHVRSRTMVLGPFGWKPLDPDQPAATARCGAVEPPSLAFPTGGGYGRPEGRGAEAHGRAASRRSPAPPHLSPPTLGDPAGAGSQQTVPRIAANP